MSLKLNLSFKIKELSKSLHSPFLPACEGLSSFWCFVFLLHCLIYKVQTAHFAELGYYITPDFVCQGFFQNFLSFFGQALARNIFMLPHSALLVKSFFRNF